SAQARRATRRPAPFASENRRRSPLPVRGRPRAGPLANAAAGSREHLRPRTGPASTDAAPARCRRAAIPRPTIATWSPPRAARGSHTPHPAIAGARPRTRRARPAAARRAGKSTPYRFADAHCDDRAASFPARRRSWVNRRGAKRAALLPQRLPDKVARRSAIAIYGQGARRSMAAAAEQPEGPWPFARRASSSFVYVSTYIFLTLPCPADKGPAARPFAVAPLDPSRANPRSAQRSRRRRRRPIRARP